MWYGAPTKLMTPQLTDRGRKGVLSSYDKVTAEIKVKDGSLKKKKVSASEFLTSSEFKAYGTPKQRLELILGKHKTGTKRTFRKMIGKRNGKARYCSYVATDGLLARVRRIENGTGEVVSLQNRGNKKTLDAKDRVIIRQVSETGIIQKQKKIPLKTFLTDPQYAAFNHTWRERLEQYFGIMNGNQLWFEGKPLQIDMSLLNYLNKSPQESLATS